jgi:acyl-CoA thioesterase-1
MGHSIPKSFQTFAGKPLLWGLFAILLQICSTFTSAATILVHGDSLSAGYGMLPNETWVALLDDTLEDHTVVNSSISGETSKGGLERLPSLLKTHQPDLVILELGANDGLRGYPVSQMAGNLQQMIQLAKESGSEVILIGIRLPPNFGKRYTQPFFEAFAELAEKNELAYLPFLLEDVAQFSELMQADGLHPTMAAQPNILENVLPIVNESLDSISNK